MLKTEFEEILITETPYYQQLKKNYREVVSFRRSFEILKKFVNNDPLLHYFSQKEGKELVFLGRRIFALQIEFIQNYLDFLKKQTLDSWEEFFVRYSNNLFEIYKRFVEGEPSRWFIFEIVNRKFLRDILTKETPKFSLAEKATAAERIGIVVNQLFNYIRNSLSRGMVISDTLFVESYGKIPLVPRCSRSEILKIMNKSLMKIGLPEPLFSRNLKFIFTSYYLEDMRHVLDEIEKLGPIFSRENITEILNSHFFFPDEDGIEKILEKLRAKSKLAIDNLTTMTSLIEKRIDELKESIAITGGTLSEELITATANFSTEDTFDIQFKKARRTLINYAYDLKKLKKDLQEYSEKKAELENILKLKPGDLFQFIIKNEWDPFILLVLNEQNLTFPSEEQFLSLIKESKEELKNDPTAMEIFNSLRVSGIFKERYNLEEIRIRFKKILQEVLKPLLVSLLIEELIDYYPRVIGETTQESLRYIAEEAYTGRVSLVEKDIKSAPKTETPSLNISGYKNLVSVLVYDIRGSTFMGTKLQNALLENEIRNLFQEVMLTVVERYGGLPIKDTGDGGIVLFCRNSYAIKKGETVQLEPGSALDAVRCGIDMTLEAVKFVQENIHRYKDWFQKAEEREINFEGITYATLPPSYQTIFQIGVGIASGEYPKEIYLDKNAFGEIDIAGMLVREANFYAKIKSRDKSTIFCDDLTVYNLLLNVEKFSFYSETGVRLDAVSQDIEQGLEYWINQRTSRRGFILDLYKILISKAGEEIIHPGSMKILLGVGDISIDETGEIKDGKGGRGKFIFEITSGTL